MWRILAVAGLTYSAALLGLPILAGLDPGASGLLARLQESGQGCASRLTLWSNILHLIGEKPWLGWGWGELDHAHFTTLYPGSRFCDILDNAHNLPLHLAVELGVPAAGLLCGLGAWLVWRARPWAQNDPTKHLAWAVLALILLHSLLEYPLWYGPFQVATALCLWLLSSPGASAQRGDMMREQWHHPPATGLRPSTTGVAVIGTALLTIAGLAYAAWDYHRISQIYLPVKSRSPAYREDTLEKIQASWLFRNQVRFANLTTTELTPQNAAQVNAMAHELLHFSPEGRVVEKLIESAVMLGRDEEALAYSARYRAAFPAEYKLWTEANRVPPAVRMPVD